MKSAFYRYLPLLLLAVAWELAARLHLVSFNSLPPLSQVAAAWVDLISDGELLDNGLASLYRGASGLALADRDRREPRHRHGVVAAAQYRDRPAGRAVLSAAEIGAHSGDGALARLRRRLENPAHLPRLHDPGHHRRLQRRARSRSCAGLVGAQHGREPAAHAVGRGGAERAAGTAQRHPHRARAGVHPAGELGADRGAEGLWLPDRLPRRQRLLRGHVRGGAHRGLPRLRRDRLYQAFMHWMLRWRE